LREFHQRKQLERAAHGGHFRVAKTPQIFVHLAVERLIGIQEPVGRGAVAAQTVHRLEHVRRGIRN
jgi:hypothetical protein